VLACCGSGCTPAAFGAVFPNGAGGGTDNCTDRSFQLPATTNNCSSVMIRVQFNGTGGERSGVDNVELVGDVINYGTITELPGGMYRSSFRVCEPTTVPVTCTWTNGTLTRQDTENVVFQ
jgi:hypothetical protein